jgi:hypothetical protein
MAYNPARYILTGRFLDSEHRDCLGGRAMKRIILSGVVVITLSHSWRAEAQSAIEPTPARASKKLSSRHSDEPKIPSTCP